MTLETAFKVWEVRMFEMGHSIKSIRKMSLEDFGNVVGYWHEKGKAEDKNARRRNNLKGGKRPGGKK